MLYDSVKPKVRSGIGGWRSVSAAVDAAALQGYSVVRNEQNEGITTIASPIHDVGNYRGRVYAAVGLSAPDERFAEQEQAIVDRVATVAASVNAALQGRE